MKPSLSAGGWGPFFVSDYLIVEGFFITETAKRIPSVVYSSLIDAMIRQTLNG
jgi:hypothetical protein